MKTLKLDNNHDLTLDESGNLAVIDGIDALRQVIETYLQTIRGEWRLNLKFGIPYTQEIFVIGADEVEVSSIFDRALLSFDEVTGISKSFGVINSRNRTYSYAAIIGSIYGNVEVQIDG